MNTRDYGGIIWTNHALDRLTDRNISQGDAWVTFRHPDQSRKGESPGAWIYFKTFGNERYEVLAKQNERKEWIILSVWKRPVYGQAIQKPPWFIRLLKHIFSLK